MDAHVHGPGCDDFEVSRRTLLRNAAAAAAVGITTSVVGDAVMQTSWGASSGSNVLVLLSLRGGVDGMSLVVPHAEPGYHAARPTIAMARSTLLQADATFGLHPGFAPLQTMWRQGRFAAIHAVGLPQPNRSHFDAMELIEDADPTSSARIGWINRMLGSLATADPFTGVQVGSNELPTSMVGPAPSLAAKQLDRLDLPHASSASLRSRTRSALTGMYAGSSLVASGGRRAISVADRARSKATTSSPRNGARYDAGEDVATALREAATAIRSGLGVRAISIDYGSWDHHESLRSRTGTMVGVLARALAAFYTDLGTLGDRVTVVTLSEFGRRLQENGAAGLDHGHGNVVLALGGGVRGGRYYCRWPDVAEKPGLDDDLLVTTDYRSVLTEIVRHRFPTVDSTKVFPGFTSQSPLGFMT